MNADKKGSEGESSLKRMYHSLFDTVIVFHQYLIEFVFYIKCLKLANTLTLFTFKMFVFKENLILLSF